MPGSDNAPHRARRRRRARVRSAQLPLTSRILYRIEHYSSLASVAVAIVVLLVCLVVAGAVAGFPKNWVSGFEVTVSAVTLVMVFVIQHTQGREQAATQRKLDELLRATPGAEESLMMLEEAPQEFMLEVEEGHREARPLPIVGGMSLEGEYGPSPSQWVRNQVEEYESSGGERANTLLDTGWPIVVVTTLGNKSGKVRKTPLMRVEHDGEYALVASKGGAPSHPVWYYNLVANPDSVTVQDGPEPFEVEVRELHGDEKATWWTRAVAAYPPYAEYQAKTEREIPVFLATRRPGA
jgi:F420H(2)-dependent quinone reductase